MRWAEGEEEGQAEPRKDPPSTKGCKCKRQEENTATSSGLPGLRTAGTQNRCLWGDERGDRREQQRPVLKGPKCQAELLGMPVGSGERDKAEERFG